MRKKLMALLMIAMIVTMQTTALAAPIEVPEDVKQISGELGAQYNMCPEVIQSVYFKESSFNPRAENGSHIGIMQVNPVWNADRMDRMGVTDLYDTKSIMLVGVDYLHELVAEYEDISVALMMYNGDSRAKGLLAMSKRKEPATTGSNQNI